MSPDMGDIVLRHGFGDGGVGTVVADEGVKIVEDGLILSHEGRFGLSRAGVMEEGVPSLWHGQILIDESDFYFFESDPGIFFLGDGGDFLFFPFCGFFSVGASGGSLDASTVDGKTAPPDGTSFVK